MNQAEDCTRLHASAVAFRADPSGQPEDWIGLLILGRSGAGKSEMALELIGHGARLVADDQTELRRDGAQVWLSAPPTIRGLIELRRMGILRASPVARARLAVVLDLDAVEPARLPERKWITLLGLPFALLHHAPGRAFAIGLKHYILGRNWQEESGPDASADT